MRGNQQHLSSAALASAGGDRVFVIRGLEPALAGSRAVGRAFTARGSRGDNLAVHQAVAQAAPGDVIVVDVQGEQETAHCGDLLARAAAVRGIRAIVLDGSIRDRSVIAELRYPVFHRGTSPRGPAKLVPGEFGVAIQVAGATVNPGDLVCADDDGIVVVPLAEIDRVVAAAAELEASEREVERRIDEGETTLAILDLPKQAR